MLNFMLGQFFYKDFYLKIANILKKNLKPIKKKLSYLKSGLKKNNLNKRQACLKFAFKSKIIDKFVIGISKYDQITEIIRILKKRLHSTHYPTN